MEVAGRAKKNAEAAGKQGESGQAEEHLSLLSEKSGETDAGASLGGTKSAPKPLNEGEEAGQDLSGRLVQLLKKAELTISTAESCTGGLLASSLVDVPGVSAVFREGFVTYSNKAKRRTLGVSKSTIRKDGAISEQTAKEMATGAALAADTDIALSVTGNAGPDADEEKPVGLVYIGIYAKGKVRVERHSFTGSRQEIRKAAVEAAFSLGIKAVEKILEKEKTAGKD